MKKVIVIGAGGSLAKWLIDTIQNIYLYAGYSFIGVSKQICIDENF